MDMKIKEYTNRYLITSLATRSVMTPSDGIVPFNFGYEDRHPFFAFTHYHIMLARVNVGIKLPVHFAPGKVITLELFLHIIILCTTVLIKRCGSYRLHLPVNS